MAATIYFSFFDNKFGYLFFIQLILFICIELNYYWQVPASTYNKSDYKSDYGSSSYLDSIGKSDYEPYVPVSYGIQKTGSRIDINNSPMDSPSKNPIYEDRVNSVLRNCVLMNINQI